MQHYLFVFGRDPQLSILELVSYLEARKIEFELKTYTKEAAHIVTKPFSIQQAIKELGGTQKIGTLLDIDNLFFNQNKIKYHIESYGKTDIEAFKTKLRKIFREERVKPIYKNIEGPQDIDKHRILQEGYEFLVYDDIIFKTEVISNPRSYAERDKKPFFDEKRTISIRLARMLINIARVKPEQTILDPYCGTGTIMQEALLLGINAIGLDNDKETCEGCNKNLYWIRKTYKPKAEWSVHNKDARRLSTYIKDVDAVVTEPYLGPFLKRLPSNKQAEKLLSDLTSDYQALLEQLAYVAKGRIVIVVPYYVTSEGNELKMDFKPLVKKAKLKVVKPLKGFEIPVKYMPQNSRLGREIWVLEK